ncbi:hypothetical protein V8E51_007031 [Hyaloscypha variabilis]
MIKDNRLNAVQTPGPDNSDSHFLRALPSWDDGVPHGIYSQLEHRKWVTLFLAKHKVDFTVNDLPPTPISSTLWDILLEYYPKLIPQTLAVFGQSMDQYHYSKTQTLLTMIHHDLPCSSVSNGINFGRLLDMVVKRASLFLDEYETSTDTCNAFMEHLRPPTKLNYPSEDADSISSMVSTWQKSGRLVLEKVTALCKTFAVELEELLENLLESEANMIRLPKIAKDVSPSLICSTQMKNDSTGASSEHEKSHLILVQCLKKEIEEWQHSDDEAIREKVAEWRAANKDLWKSLISEEQDVDN